MTSAAQVIAYARSWQGYRDNGGMEVWRKYAPFDYHPSSYCGAGQCVVQEHFKLSLGPTTHARIISVPLITLDARKAGLWKFSKDGQPGDLVVEAFGKGEHDLNAWATDHVERLLINNPASATVTTFGFNTTDGTGQGTRGAFVRTRLRSDIAGLVDMQHTFSAPSPAPVKPTIDSPYIIGPMVTRAWQKYEGSTADGNISSQDISRKGCVQASLWPTIHWTASPQGSQLFKAVQKRLRLPADGILGPVTAEGIQGWLGVTRDGVLGPKSTAALCHKLGIK